MTRLLTIMLTTALLVGCSTQPTKPAGKPQPKGPEPVTGRYAFQKLYVAAHGWARDAQPYQLLSLTTSDSKGAEGKSCVWRAGFASSVQRGTKPYVWSGSDAQDAPPRGVNPGTEDTYNPNNSSTQVFDMGFLKIDSDKALEVAKAHGGDKVLAKSPDTPILYVLDWSHSTNQLIWHVIYGNSRDDAKLRVAVDATSGEFIRVEK
jgi:hypothetical protein